MDIFNAIRERESIRTFKDENIKEKDIEKIEKYLNSEEQFQGLFGNQIRFKFINLNNKTDDITRYGIMKNAKGIVVGITQKTKDGLLDLGYAMEKVILYLTDMGIATCWMGAFFSRKELETKYCEENEFVPCICTIGYQNRQHLRLIEKAFKSYAKSSNRKPWSEIFFYKNFDEGFKKENAEKMELPLKMLRQAPSAANFQPWRVLISDDKKKAHFYADQLKKYGRYLDYDIKMVDMGIALCHFDLSIKELNLDHQWTIDEPNKYIDGYEYLISCHLNY